ncbi:hypothetical protein BP5796_04439 [Coleophoma crateriformis]|uniref:DUF1593-domain-containing protein n=1 Tax=Coleophoma crateriformis TaxID=565419 RepID=A0A3D8SAZ6_9HELO|nr:hypothetical protein BP5796_04439 [Coleophoma crateriformis]
MASRDNYKALPALSSKPHIAVLTDICNEPDDAESMTRFLLYTNEFSIDALVATTSTWQRTSTHKDEILGIIDAYAAVEATLNHHVPSSRQYPTADSLRAVVRSGLDAYGMEAARGPLSEGTELLIKAIDAIASDGHIWVLVWGGSNVLAQALLEVQKTRSESEVATFASKLRVYAISDQDDAGPWIRLKFPKMFYIASVHAFNMYGLAAWTGISGETYYNFDAGGPDTSLVTKEWIKENIQIGPYGKKAYPDHIFIPEGDTPTFLSLIQNGLTDPLQPSWGGWGGRYELTERSGESFHYSDAPDTVVGKDGQKHIGGQATIWRWRDAYQGDFAARMQWTLDAAFDSANHAPVVVVNGSAGLEAVHVRAAFGSKLQLDASQSWDPDENDSLTFKWFHYREPSATNWSVHFEVPTLEAKDISGAGGRKFEKVEIALPGEAEGCPWPFDETKVFKYGEKTYHFVLEVTDNGKKPMKAYRRILITVGAHGSETV